MTDRYYFMDSITWKLVFAIEICYNGKRDWDKNAKYLYLLCSVCWFVCFINCYPLPWSFVIIGVAFSVQCWYCSNSQLKHKNTISMCYFLCIMMLYSRWILKSKGKLSIRQQLRRKTRFFAHFHVLIRFKSKNRTTTKCMLILATNSKGFLKSRDLQEKW